MLRGAMEAQGRVGLMLNVKVDDLQAVLEVLPALNSPTISTLSDSTWVAVNTILEEQPVLGGDSAAEGCECARHRRVSAEQGGDVMRILAGRRSGERGRPAGAACSRLDEMGPGAQDRPGSEKAVATRRLSAMPQCGMACKRASPCGFRTDEIAEAWQLDSRRNENCLAPGRRQHPPVLPMADASRVAQKDRTAANLARFVRPLESVGCYVPGGRYPLPSTLLMTVIPAQVAGVPRICVVSPRPQPATLAAAALARHSRGLPLRRCAGHRRARLWHGDALPAWTRSLARETALSLRPRSW